jgi:hypothetical protein
MRPNLMIGIVLVVIGGILFFRGGGFTTQKEVLEVGDVKVTAPDHHSVPNWLPPLAVIGGFGLIVFGGMQKRA